MFRFILLILIIFLFLFVVLNNDMLLFPAVKKITDGENIILKNNVNNSYITIFFPGNSSKILDYKDKLQHLPKNIIIVNYRKNKKKFGEYKHAIRNALLAYEYAHNNYKNIHIVNYSIGNGIFSDILKYIKFQWSFPKKITIISGICNIKDILYHNFWIFSFICNWVLYNKLDTNNNFIKYIPNHIPILIIHGYKDKIVPFYLVQKMYQELLHHKKNISFQSMSEKGHNDIDHLPFF
jgi:hypothetical protein